MAIPTALVSYHNTLPFLYAIRESAWSDHFDLHIATPSKCAQLYQDGMVDLALVPVGALHELSNYSIITETCIGSFGDVYTVALFSDKPIHECTHMVLDQDSRTSNDLAQILLKNYLHIPLEIRSFDQTTADIDPYTAHVIIGDKVFENEDKYHYKYDLSKLWQRYTGLPFVFAVWVLRNTVEQEKRVLVETVINNYSLKNIKNKVIGKNLTLHDYLTQYISFHFDQDKKTALQHFLTLQKILHESYLLLEKNDW